MRVNVHAPDPRNRDFAWLDANRDSWMQPFADLVSGDERVSGRVLDVGCGGKPPSSEGTIIRKSSEHIGTWDGLDPSDDVFEHPHLTNRWKGGVEDLVASGDIPAGAYDAAISCFVFEHVSDPRAHLGAVAKVLRPGGAFFGYTPNRWHPFAAMSRAIEVIGLKGRFSNDGSDESVSKVNDYPAYYRLGSAGSMARAARGLGFKSIDVWYVPCTQWQAYFPPALRFGPRLYERVLGSKVRGLHQMLVFRMEKEGEWTPSASHHASANEQPATPHQSGAHA